MTTPRRIKRHASWRRASLLLVAVSLTVLAAHCTNGDKPPQTMQEKYNLSDDEAWLWDRLYVADAETTATVFWGLVGQGRFDEALLMIERFGDKKMVQVFEDRVEKLWLPVHRWPAKKFTEEQGFGLGESETIGFRTWGELWSSGFQRGVLCEDSITVYFVFKGYWQTDSIPLYAAVSCGDFGEHTPQWRPFPYPVFSIDATQPTIDVYGVPVRCRTLDEFCEFLRKRTYGTLGT